MNPPTKLVAAVIAVWTPAAAVALIVSFQAATIARLVEEMGPGGPALLSGLPWWGLWLVLAGVLLVVVAGLTLLLKKKLWLAVTVSAVSSAVILAGTFYAAVIQPTASVFAGL